MPRLHTFRLGCWQRPRMHVFARANPGVMQVRGGRHWPARRSSKRRAARRASAPKPVIVPILLPRLLGLESQAVRRPLPFFTLEQMYSRVKRVGEHRIVRQGFPKQRKTVREKPFCSSIEVSALFLSQADGDAGFSGAFQHPHVATKAAERQTKPCSDSILRGFSYLERKGGCSRTGECGSGFLRSSVRRSKSRQGGCCNCGNANGRQAAVHPDARLCGPRLPSKRVS